MYGLDQLIIFCNLRANPVIENFRKLQTAKEPYHKIEHLFLIQQNILDDDFIGVLTWKEMILELILTDENSFTLKCEKKEVITDDLMSIVTGDIQILRSIYNYDWNSKLEELDIKRSTLFSLDKGRYPHNYELHSLMANENIGERFIVNELVNYINKKGTGRFSKNYVYKWVEPLGLKTIKDYDHVEFRDLIGYERQINALKENTLKFMEKGKANNVLLYGPRGTGKSSSLKALVSEFAEDGLRIIELKKHQVKHISDILEIVRKRDFKFILFIDDLSFEEFETEYKAFKAVIEGSFEKKPDNVLIYVTSNRRHLIRESFKDRDEDLHLNETVQEKLSLFDRFGMTILYDQPKDEVYNEMVIELARRNEITMPDEELLKLANEWKMKKSSKSGRTAQQLIDSLL